MTARHCLLLASTHIAVLFSVAQNVGIGTAVPTEKLDVSGSINVTGTIKANGVDGQANQVLMKNSSGNLAWGFPGEFRNMVTFTDTSAAIITWPVPPNVTKVWVELWGGGGAGLECGGGGGGYLSMLLDIIPGENLHVTVGKGGQDNPTTSGTATTAKSGTRSRIEHAGNYDAMPGTGAQRITGGSFPVYNPGVGGSYTLSAPATTSPRGSFYAESGQAGGIFTSQYGSATNNLYYQNRYYGIGGAAGHMSHVTQGAFEQFSIVVSPSSTTRTMHSAARPGGFPGGGGGGGPDLPNDVREGANGLVIIHY